ncbi:DNA-directed RNA polymerase subunit omega [Siminovitchia sp. FSL H7-0308]|uniref:DNA-directed RNA polymerase subunit omega n=1 Tax=Siminovitchia thermophila TaxID=1245522 RepID=A0ABS2R7H6_9BACI|nr:DNA-directed RNA polymerase subunit omega [Siminovitchia thermophila]MBM7715616.1 DNA-directed RNA polymerase subunit omega [Siminovitchia thermophila]ONK23287.1 DNA-directed RNA polymerase subunit omega [Bacillus sp. VT-16-64]
MLYPSIDKLMEVIDSKYSLVSIAAKRARDLKDHNKPLLEKYVSHKYVGKALEEINEGVLKVKVEDNALAE